ncbi:unnamed protein product [marine sediment metagenome]|uniref:Uncharacterized protein n=1 Tax=marine sediment metagenome TaxID=412755 RepID=X1V091_9ZZZZ
MDWYLVLDVAILCGILLILRGLIEIRRAVEDGIEDLDHKLAASLQKMLSEGMMGDGFEPPSLVQQALAQFITTKMGSPGLVEPLRGEAGKFIKPE